MRLELPIYHAARLRRKLHKCLVVRPLTTQIIIIVPLAII
jgi:hypothetical protein